MRAAGPHPAAPGFVLENGHDRRTAETECREPSKQQARAQAEAGAHDDHRPVDSERCLEFRRHRLTHPPRHERRSVEEHERGERSTETREHDCLREKVLHEPSPRGADRLPDRQLAFAHRAAHLDHPRNVQAHHQQRHRAHRAPDSHDDRHVGSLDASQGVVRRGDPGLELVGRRIGFRQPGRDGGNGGIGLRHSDARRQSPLDAHPRLAPVEATVTAGEKGRVPLERNEDLGTL